MWLRLDLSHFGPVSDKQGNIKNIINHQLGFPLNFHLQRNGSDDDQFNVCDTGDLHRALKRPAKRILFVFHTYNVS